MSVQNEDEDMSDDSNFFQDLDEIQGNESVTKLDKNETLNDSKTKNQLSYVVKSIPLIHKLYGRSKTNLVQSEELQNKMDEQIEMLANINQHLKEMDQRLVNSNSGSTIDPIATDSYVELNNLMPFKTMEKANAFFNLKNENFMRNRTQLEEK